MSATKSKQAWNTAHSARYSSWSQSSVAL